MNAITQCTVKSKMLSPLKPALEARLQNPPTPLPIDRTLTARDGTVAINRSAGLEAGGSVKMEPTAWNLSGLLSSFFSLQFFAILLHFLHRTKQTKRQNYFYSQLWFDLVQQLSSTRIFEHIQNTYHIISYIPISITSIPTNCARVVWALIVLSSPSWQMWFVPEPYRKLAVRKATKKKSWSMRWGKRQM